MPHLQQVVALYWLCSHHLIQEPGPHTHTRCTVHTARLGSWVRRIRSANLSLMQVNYRADSIAVPCTGTCKLSCIWRISYDGTVGSHNLGAQPLQSRSHRHNRHNSNNSRTLRRRLPCRRCPVEVSFQYNPSDISSSGINRHLDIASECKDNAHFASVPLGAWRPHWRAAAIPVRLHGQRNNSTANHIHPSN